MTSVRRAGWAAVVMLAACAVHSAVVRPPKPVVRVAAPDRVDVPAPTADAGDVPDADAAVFDADVRIRRLVLFIESERLPPEVVPAIKGRLSEWQACYREGLRRDATLSGVLEIDFDVLPEQAVANVKVLLRTLDAAVTNCVVQALYQTPPLGPVDKDGFRVHLTLEFGDAYVDYSH